MNNYKCGNCGHRFRDDYPVCPNCIAVACEDRDPDLLTDEDFISIDEALEEIEGKDDPMNEPT